MPTAPPQTTESTFTPPRKKPSVYWWLGGIFLLLVCLFLYQLFGPNPRILVSKQTTYITEPLLENGLPNYEAYYRATFSEGVTPENNAAALLFQALGPGDLNPQDAAAVAKELGLTEVPTNATSLRPIYCTQNRRRITRWLHEQGRLTLPGGRPAKDEIIQQALNMAPLPLSDEAQALVDLADTEIDRASSRPWTTDQIPPLGKWLSESQEHIDLIVQASRRPRYYSPSPSVLNGDRNSLASALPQLQASREAAQTLFVRAMWHLGEGRPNDAWQDILAIHRLAQLLSDDSPIANELVAYAISRIACVSTQTLFDQGNLTAELARQVQSDLATLPSFSMSGAMDKGERLIGLDLIVAFTLDNGLGFILTADGMSLDVSVYAFDSVSVDWNIVLRDFNACYDQLAAAVVLPTREQRLMALENAEADILQAGGEPRSPSNLIAAAFSIQRRSKLLSGIMSNLLLPAITAVMNSQDRANATLELTRIAAALAVFKAEHGSYPAKLIELVPAVVATLPVDPFTDKPFRYVRTDTGYVLYSVGENGDDDGGSNDTMSIFEGISLDDTAMPNPPPQIPNGADDLSVRLPRPPLKPPGAASQPTETPAQ